LPVLFFSVFFTYHYFLSQKKLHIDRSTASPSTMKLSLYLLSISAAAAQAINVVQSNDDGWAEINIRQQYESLTSAGFNSFISASAIDRSGTGSSDAPPTTVGSGGCEFGSCPAGSPPIGNNASMPRFNVSNITNTAYRVVSLSSEI
jgi:hypothetical protein